ncbi:ERG2/sigma1 receptor-like protein [Mycena sp. CBHHK59/15]|nr:ERG2/sigma1 receptor-like protein [Mycena sp. CBHHK59/15]
MPRSTKSKSESSAENPRGNLSKWAMHCGILFLLLVIGRWLDHVKHRWYVFEPSEVHEIAQAAIAASPNDTAGMIQHIVTNLVQTHPSNKVKFNLNSNEWVFNTAGGAMGAMYIIHASITEYLIIFGTPLGTEGHTGVLTVDNYFNILVGEQWAFSPGQLEMERYTPGTVHHSPRGTTKQYKMHRGCFALEYSRGWIPFMLPFGFWDVFTSNFDIPSVYTTVRIAGREMIRNILTGKI